MKFAPIVLFTHSRLAHTGRAIDSLLRNPEAEASRLIVYSDGVRGPPDASAVRAVRSYLRGISGFNSVQIIQRETNYGLARNIIEGVTEVLAEHRRAIVLEDDLVVSPHFLRFMNDALDLYVDVPQVASIHGYCYPVAEPLPETFFLRGADCWGWATWSRAWAHFEPDGGRLLTQLRTRELTREFDLDGAYPFTRMLEDQVAGRNNSWAIRWHASCFLKDLLTLYPGRSLVENTGNDASGTHCASTDDFSLTAATSPLHVERIEPVPSTQARRAFARFLDRHYSFQARASRAFRRWHRSTA